MKKILFSIITILSVISCTTAAPKPASSEQATSFRYEKPLAIGDSNSNILKPVSVIGTQYRGEIGSKIDCGDFIIKVEKATITVTSPNGNGMSDPEVTLKNGQLILTWHEIDDCFCKVVIIYKNGKLTQSKIISKAL
jgi:hypothetical protein